MRSSLINVVLWILGGSSAVCSLCRVQGIHNEMVLRALLLFLSLIKIICLITALCETTSITHALINCGVLLIESFDLIWA